MPGYVTDTHALIWYLEDNERLGAEASQVFTAADRGEFAIYVPTICLVEIVYLTEKGRIPAEFKSALDTHLASDATSLVPVDLTPGVVDALAQIDRAVVADLPDRIIAATAALMDLPLLSRDRAIQASGVTVVW